jgi:hypothetical protein
MSRSLLIKTISLVGQTEKITAMELRKTPGDILLQCQMGKVFEITRNGVVVAVLSPPELNALELGALCRQRERRVEKAEDRKP